MPKGTRVHRCVERMKKRGGSANPYAVCQAAMGQSYATGKSLKSHLPSGVLLSPKGDLGQHRAHEASAASGKLKTGSIEKASSYLPYRPEPMVIDTKFGPGDKVC